MTDVVSLHYLVTRFGLGASGMVLAWRSPLLMFTIHEVGIGAHDLD